MALNIYAHLHVSPTRDQKYEKNSKEFPKSNSLRAGTYLHNTDIVIDTISNLEMI